MYQASIVMLTGMPGPFCLLFPTRNARYAHALRIAKWANAHLPMPAEIPKNIRHAIGHLVKNPAHAQIFPNRQMPDAPLMSANFEKGKCPFAHA